MKKILLAFILLTVVLGACKDDDYYRFVYPTLDTETQNRYDDIAIKDYLENTYITSRGKITTAKTDANNDSIENRKLADLDPITLPSGVVIIKIPDAQPQPGTQVNADDYIKFQNIGYVMRAVKNEDEDKITFATNVSFFNTIDGSGVALTDPMWYHVKNSVLEAAEKAAEEDPTDLNKAKTKRSYYEIEGFQEAIQKFKSFDLQPEDPYNMQGIIIVPSRAAFAKDSHYNYIGVSLNDMCFVLNFQLYQATPRTPEEE